MSKTIHSGHIALDKCYYIKFYEVINDRQNQQYYFY